MISLSIKINKLKWTENIASLKVLSDFVIGKIITKFECVKFIMYVWFRKYLFIIKCIYNAFRFPVGD